MSSIDPRFLNIEYHKAHLRESDFNNMLSVFKRQKPARHTLFEMGMDDVVQERFYGDRHYGDEQMILDYKKKADAYRIEGYDFICMHGSDFYFKREHRESKATTSMNGRGIITDWESFERYEWTDPECCDYSRLDIVGKYIPDGMRIIVTGSDGVLENVIGLTGYDTLCFLLADEPELVKALFDAVGSRLVKYNSICASFDKVGAICSNDDWGFKTQTMLSANDMRNYVIPWHKKIVEAAHAAGKPALLHSCGNLELVMDDIINDINFDAKHSYEDVICPVETMYRKYGGRIAVLGGMDLDFLCRSTPEDVYHRSAAMLEMTSAGGYALGSGNTIPYYVPFENYLAMISAAKW